jgi:hypothetical protein
MISDHPKEKSSAIPKKIREKLRINQLIIDLAFNQRRGIKEWGL